MPRRVNKQKLRSPIPTIVGAGITEHYYFKHLRSKGIGRWSITPRFFGTESLNKLQKRVDNIINNGGYAICVFDTDTARDNDTETKKLVAFKKRYENKDTVLLCDSCPSIEYWFLLHFENTNRYFASSDKVIKVLHKYLADFEKTEKFLENVTWVDALCKNNGLCSAIERAKCFSKGPNSASYSNVFKIFGAV